MEGDKRATSRPVRAKASVHMEVQSVSSRRLLSLPHSICLVLVTEEANDRGLSVAVLDGEKVLRDNATRP